jgi:plastocyanin
MVTVVTIGRPRPASGALLLALAVAGCSSNPPTPAPSPTATISRPVPGAARIVIRNYAFLPANLTVHPGDKITVTNLDGVQHTLTENPGTAFDTGTLNGGASATITAPSAAGIYPYICDIHPFMRGILTVR